MPSLFRLFAALPLWLLHPLGALIGWVAFVASGTYRRRFLANARQAGYGFGAVAPAVGHAGRMVAELPRMWMGRQPSCQMHNEECVRRAYAAGRGIIFLTPHLGCFEITAQAYAARFGARRPMTVLFRPPRLAALRDLVVQARQRPGLQTAPVSLAGVRQLMRALKAGEAVEQHGHEDEEGEDFEAVAELDEDGDRETREPREQGHAERHEAEASEQDALFADALAQCREGECV